jgi:predicted Zn-dependent protease
MAAGHEKFGHYREAVTYLRRLVEVDPKSAEGRLRLAINLIRTGATADGRAILRRLLAEANPPWVLSLAYQQLARERLDAGDPAGAAEMLQQAVDRLPGDQRLELAYAFALDRLGEPERASLRIARIDGGTPGESPRYLYNEWPDEGTAEVEALLETSTRVRLPRLAAALAAAGGSE